MAIISVPLGEALPRFPAGEALVLERNGNAKAPFKAPGKAPGPGAHLVFRLVHVQGQAHDNAHGPPFLEEGLYRLPVRGAFLGREGATGGGAGGEMLARGPANVAQAIVEGEEKPGLSHCLAVPRGAGEESEVDAQAFRGSLAPGLEGDFEQGFEIPGAG